MKNEFNKYTERDIVDIRKSAIDSIKNSNSKWNDFNESDLGMILIETMAGIADYSNYYLDNQALESNLMTARQPKNIKGILESYNIKLKTLGSAIGEVNIYITQPIYALIPAYTQLQSVNGIYYVTTEPKVITEDDEIVTIPIMQGSRYIEKVKSSILKSNYKYFIQIDDVPVDSVRIVQNNQDWELVDDAFLEVSGGPKYSVHEDNKGRVYILFTYDANNYLPQDDNEYLRIYYVESIGTKGTVPPLYVTGLVDQIVDSNKQPVNSVLELSNPTSTYGAYDKVNYHKLKAIGRNRILTMDRFVTLSDYKAGIESEPYVIDSYTCDWRTDATRVQRPYQVKSWVITTDSLSDNIDTMPLLTNLSEYMMSKGDIAVYVTIYAAYAKDLDIEVDLVIRGTPKFKEDVRNKVIEYINDRFSLYNLKLADKVDKEEFEIEISKISPSILSAEVTSIGKGVSCTDIEFFKLNNTTVNILNSDEIDYGLLDGGIDGRRT